MNTLEFIFRLFLVTLMGTTVALLGLLALIFGIAIPIAMVFWLGSLIK